MASEPNDLGNSHARTVVLRRAERRAHGKLGRPEAQRRFLACFEATGTAVHAARAAKVSARAHYKWLAEDPTYPVRFKQSVQLAVRMLEDECVRRARLGVRKLVTYKGKPVKDPDTGGWLYEVEYSDNLLMFLMKSYDRKRFGDKVETSFTQNWDGNIEDLPEEFLRQVLAKLDAQAAAIKAKEQGQLPAAEQVVDVTNTHAEHTPSTDGVDNTE